MVTSAMTKSTSRAGERGSEGLKRSVCKFKGRREGFSEKMIFEQRLEGRKKTQPHAYLGKSIQEEGITKGQGSNAKHVQGRRQCG